MRYALIAMIYSYFNLKLKKWIIVTIVPIVLACMGMLLDPGSLKLFPSAALLITGLAIIFFTLFSFTEMMKNPISRKLTYQPLFWFNTGNLIFTTTTFVFLGFFHSISESIYKTFLLEILFVSNLVLYVCYFFAIILDGRLVIHDKQPNDEQQ
jgi:hypothetical protein